MLNLLRVGSQSKHIQSTVIHSLCHCKFSSYYLNIYVTFIKNLLIEKDLSFILQTLKFNLFYNLLSHINGMFYIHREHKRVADTNLVKSNGQINSNVVYSHSYCYFLREALHKKLLKVRSLFLR